MKKTYKVLKTLGNVILVILIVALALVTILVAVSRLTGNGSYLIGGYGFGYVITGSMEPTIPVGSVILVHQTDPGEIAVDDVIMFHSDDPNVPADTPVTHRVVAITQPIVSSYEFTTKGDANTIEDPYPVAGEDLIGRVEWSSPMLGKVIDFLKQPWIYPVLIGLLGLDLIWNIVLVAFYADKVQQEAEQSQQNKDNK